MTKQSHIDLDKVEQYFVAHVPSARRGKPGDMFVIDLVDGGSFPVRVVEKATAALISGSWVLYIYAEVGRREQVSASSFDLRRLLVPPVFVASELWRGGQARHFGFEALSDEQLLQEHSFEGVLGYEDASGQPARKHLPYGDNASFLSGGILKILLHIHLKLVELPTPDGPFINWIGPEWLTDRAKNRAGKVVELPQMAELQGLMRTRRWR